MTSVGPPGRTALYRFFAANDSLLYVGITFDPPIRFAAHVACKPAWPQVARITIDWHDTRVAAERAERAAIQDERPTWNIAVPGINGRWTGVGRRPWVETPDQIRLLEAAAEHFRQAEQGWTVLAEAVAAGVPKDRIPEYVPHSRATVLRKLTQLERGRPTANGRKTRRSD